MEEITNHTKHNCAEQLLQHITNEKRMCHTLIISPPDCQRTFLLTDLVHLISKGNKCVKQSTVGVVNQHEKAEGIISLIRSILPQVIVINGLETIDEFQALEYAKHCGCKLLVTVQGSSIDELLDKPLFGQLIKEKHFERYVILKNSHSFAEIEKIYDERGTCIQ